MTGEIQRRVLFPEVVNIDRDELADADTGVVHERDYRVVAFLEIVGTGLIHRGSERVDLVGFEPHARLNLGILISYHVAGASLYTITVRGYLSFGLYRMNLKLP